MARPRRILVSITTGLLAAALATVACSAAGSTAQPNSATPTGPAAAAAPRSDTAPAGWSYLRHTCRTSTAGTACVSLFGNGRPSTYQVKYYLAPAPGQWMRRLAAALWYAYPIDGLPQRAGIRTDGYRPACAGTCPAVTAPTSWDVATSTLSVYTMLYDTPQGRLDVHAGLTPIVLGSDGYSGTVGSVATRIQLMTTADNRVWFGRGYQFQVQSPLIGQLFDNGKSIYTQRYCRSYCPEVHDLKASRIWYRPWTRTGNSDGSWQVTFNVLAKVVYAYRDYDVIRYGFATSDDLVVS